MWELKRNLYLGIVPVPVLVRFPHKFCLIINVCTSYFKLQFLLMDKRTMNLRKDLLPVQVFRFALKYKPGICSSCFNLLTLFLMQATCNCVSPETETNFIWWSTADTLLNCPGLDNLNWIELKILYSHNKWLQNNTSSVGLPKVCMTKGSKT